MEKRNIKAEMLGRWENGIWHQRERGKEMQNEAEKVLRVLLLIKKLIAGLS